MDQQLPLANVITPGVREFAGEREFYRRLGWPRAFDSDGFTVFGLRGALLALFGIDQPGAGARATPEPGHGGIRSSVIIAVDRPEDVGALVRHAREAGGTVTREPADAEFFEGRDAYFADPEGSYREVAWAARDNPVTAAARRAAGIATGIQPK
jgi:catechol 2,3-dioxygenase-like lactoylglutathione lyase family enzyme